MDVAQRNIVGRAFLGIVAYLIEDFLDDDDDDENLWEHVTVDINEFCVMGDPSFQWHFRLTKPVFEILLQEIGNHLVDNMLMERERRPVAHILLMVLVLRDMKDTYITWPNAEERNTIKRNCQRISNFPGIVGIMDGSHIFIKAPKEERAAYRNYKYGYSIKVQAVVDDSLLVRDAYIGEVVSLHDARVFRRSPLCRSILQRQDLFSNGEHIIADAAYMLLDRVLVPFVNNGHLTVRQRNYNRKLSQVRVRVEHTFGRIDSLWRRMTYLPNTNIDYAVDHIAASIVLHNFNIIHKQAWNIVSNS
ncbi:putative nuclease HARBI1 [Frankliniella occidentalis]|uniref:Nuclease HARBI1 n=1 Tax=Frankliniella occidentalis TaxID=133901 RepID=A0A9C6XRT3_FRAOC|nr:putative nuclease HARBI1 [Frankliniella occidentalis]